MNNEETIESSEQKPQIQNNSDSSDSSETRFKEGQILKMVRVRFPGNSRSFPFLIGKRNISYGEKVVAMSDRGVAVGYVNSFPYEIAFKKEMLPVKSISKVATDEDFEKDQDAYRKEKETEALCQKLIEKHNLEMNLTHVEFTQFGKKTVFYFVAPARVDFRGLVRDLVGELKTRVELRQISVRDRSAAVGGIGPCGRELCCSSFLSKYGNVGIKMAKAQDLSINYSKLNGVCGQLKCCLQYEDEVYQQKRKNLPKERSKVLCHSGDKGEVIRHHLLKEQFDIITDRGVKKRFVAEQFKEYLNDLKMPDRFDTISDETRNIIGLEEAQKNQEKRLKEEVSELTKKSPAFAEKVFEDLFGEKSLDYSLPELNEPDNPRKVKIVEEDEEVISTFTDPEDRLYQSLAKDNPEEEQENQAPSEQVDKPREENRNRRPRNKRHRYKKRSRYPKKD